MILSWFRGVHKKLNVLPNFTPLDSNGLHLVSNFVLFTGVAYVIDTGMQNCTIKPISKNFIDKKKNGSYHMLNPLDLFHMNKSYKFIGQVFVFFVFAIRTLKWSEWSLSFLFSSKL